MLNSMGRMLIHVLRKPTTGRYCLGSLAATHVLLWLTWFTATWGFSVWVAGALAVSASLALLIDGRLHRTTAADVAQRRSHALLLLAGWTLALPGLLSFSPELLHWTPLDDLQGPMMIFAVALAAAVLLVTPGGIILLQAVTNTAKSEESSAARDVFASSSTLFGGATVFLLMPITLAARMNLQWLAWFASGIAIALGLIAWFRRSQSSTGSVAAAHDLTTRHFATPPHLRVSLVGDLWVGMLSGVGICVASLITGQLVAHAAYATFARLAGVTAGIAAGMLLGRRSRAGDVAGHRIPVVETLLVAVGCSALVVLFPQMMRAALHISAYASRTSAILLLRGGLLAVAFVPFGVALGLRCARHVSLEPGSHSRVGLILAMTAFTVAVARMFELPVVAGMGATTLASAAMVLLRFRIDSTARPDRKQLVTAISLLALLATGLCLNSRFDPSRSARALFSTSAFLAYRAGTPADQLHEIDDGRLCESIRCDGSTWTTWMHAGRQLLVREDGLPRGVSSLDPSVFPEMSVEMLPTVLPLVMHPAPREVTLVGIGGSTALSACLSFPVLNVTCVEPHAALLHVARECAAAGAGLNPFADSRLHVIRTEPEMAAAARHPPQDIIVLNCGQSFLSDATAQFTTAYYRRLASSLAPGGLLCQRLYYGDFGVQPIREMAATLRDVFPQVILVETGPGEIVFLASRSPEPIVEADMLHRASRPHVRALMSRLGWDWSVLPAMQSLNTDALDKLTSGGPAHANTAVCARFTFELPIEVARWGSKQQEVNDVLGPLSSRLYENFADPSTVGDLSFRLADVAERQKLIQQHPDVFWAYRDKLRERLQKRPRITIQQVAHEGLQRGLDPEDERRKEYLIELGRAATQSTPDVPSIEALNSFIEPYDPLVSYFAHYEIARLYARVESPDPAAELTHRLHSVFFSTGPDRSVRNVTAAIDLLLTRPEALPDPQRRWDTLNALLEVLMRRWQLRAASDESTRYEAADVNDSFDTAQRALDAMDELASIVSVSTEDWQTRRSLLEQHLIRPLRNQRSKQRT